MRRMSASSYGLRAVLALIKSPLRGENTASKSRYAAATTQASAAWTGGSAGVAASAIATADNTDAMVPDAYIAAARRLETIAREPLSVDRVRTGRSRARPDMLRGRTLAKVVRPRLILRNLIPRAVPTR